MTIFPPPPSIVVLATCLARIKNEIFLMTWYLVEQSLYLLNIPHSKQTLLDLVLPHRNILKNI